MRMFSKLTLALALAGVAIAAPAVAHPKLVSATPAADASVKATTRIVLVFSEKLMAPLSGATLIMTGMPGMQNHPDMKMSGVTAKVGADGKSLELVSAKPLPAGSYRIDWHVVGGDTHRITGQHRFNVG
ncbi:copper homeostasis periplasmic binding protein CopC [Sphingomonas qomolangmaensis]|uniref:Copper homeostasis periplasmic binding protein CopC n=1 Tax=Sphingomonas qomolangmaensis TaxID=2918765 RepID=A0ABY5LAM3_9SPHN|nr:copper homeostasis periplasmic binding protein CopC [Sphingomonas qomolangmaensis]UUL83817.1 copper homeostasis periplasmic binding protein CopC [Sphingomonas qomolangmaensis]